MKESALVDTPVLLEMINRRLEELLGDDPSIPTILSKASLYAVLSGGKRLRPLLTLTTAYIFGKDLDKALNTACAIEMIHAYSLIHDDLPCMDDDDFRRGIPTVHKKFNEAVAVLTGDYLLTKAFEILSHEDIIPLETRLKLISTLSKASGGSGMIGGQILDIEAEGKAIDLNALQKIHQKKTGCLITASMLAGAYIAQVDPPTLEIVCSFGNKLGLAFQIMDDVIDVLASEEKHGKKLSSDQINQKTTYTTLLGIEAAKKEAFRLYHDALMEMDKLPQDTTFLKALAHQLVSRTS